jgi:hypothetical protein
MYLDNFMVAEAASAKGTAGIVSADKVTVGAPPISAALAGRVLGAYIKKPSLM